MKTRLMEIGELTDELINMALKSSINSDSYLHMSNDDLKALQTLMRLCGECKLLLEDIGEFEEKERKFREDVYDKLDDMKNKLDLLIKRSE